MKAAVAYVEFFMLLSRVGTSGYDFDLSTKKFSCEGFSYVLPLTQPCSLFAPRSRNIQERRRYVDLVEGVRDNGGEVKIFSSLHVSGEQV